MGRPPGAGGAAAATAIIDVVNCAFSPLACALRNVVIWIMEGILGLASLIVGLAGVILNGIIYYTIVDVAQNYERITAINSTWTAVRDLSNMVFIFLLLYAAISTIIGRGEDTKKLIVHIIIVAILINFSLFFTKIVIDAANVLALFFYSAINPGLISPGFSLTGGTGLSDSFMQHLNLTSLYRPGDTLSMSTIFTIGIMGTIMLMVAAFVFFSVAIMFLVRYVVLILVLILSPLAFLSWVFPAMREAGTKWLNALVGQAFFAPIYLMITWIALRVLGDVGAAFGTTTGGRTALSGLTSGSTSIDPGVFATFVNFLVVIIFLLASLAIAKSWANRAGDSVAKANKWLTGAAVGGAVGGAALFGRQTVGRAATRIADSEKLKESARDGSRSARLALWAGRKGGAASFDVRNTGLRGAMGVEAPKTKKGYEGFVGGRKAYAEKQAKIAESYAPSEGTKIKAQRDYDDAVKRYGAESPQAQEAKKNRDQILGADKVRKEAFAKRMENSVIGKLRGYNYAAAAQVRKGSKSTKDKLAEAAKEYAEELDGGTKKEKPEAPSEESGSENNPKAT